jgi:polysaccharide export outer membrane protein
MSGRVQKFFVRRACLLAVSFCSFSLGAQTPVAGENPSSAPEKQAASAPTTGPVANSNTKLGPGDLIEVSVFGVPELATKARVSSSGELYLPLIDYVHVADLTTDEAQELIRKRLEDGGFVRSPHVSIFVDESASQAVMMVGEVAHPGAYPVIGDRKLFDMLSLAGGFTERAGRSVVIVHRGDPDHRVELQLPRNLAEDTTHNVDVQPGDTIIVSRAGIIYVVGDVAHPSGFMVEDDRLTVLKALALAGGSTKTSSLNKTKILRPTSNGMEQIPVPLKKILHAKAQDIPLAKGDVLFIPGSSAKAAAYRSADAAMSLTTAVGVVALHP